jgi:hypothetical protein
MMVEEPTYMKLDKDMTHHIVSLFPELEKDIKDDGYLYIPMLKAMYGFIQGMHYGFSDQRALGGARICH